MSSTPLATPTAKTIVFGGTSGIGEAAARLFAASGHAVTIVGRDAAKAATAAGRIGNVSAAAVDAGDRTRLDAFFTETGAFDHLVLCHSSGKGAGPFRTLDLHELLSGLEGKLLAQFRAAQAALPQLKSGGSITFVSGASSRATLPGTAGLAAINAGIDAAVRILAKELAPVRVNAVSPGVIDTPWWDAMPQAAKDSFFEQAAQQLPVRRVGQPEDVAQAILAVATNGFITGSVLEVDGGARLI